MNVHVCKPALTAAHLPGNSAALPGSCISCRASSARAAELAQNAFAQDERNTNLASREAAVAAATQDLQAREAALQAGQQALTAAQSELHAAQLVNDQRETALTDREMRLQAKVGSMGQG